MRNTFLKAAAIAAALSPAILFAQSKPTTATYITDEDVKAVNALPGVDRTIKVVDIGPENFAVGVIHRGATGAAARGAGAGAGVLEAPVRPAAAQRPDAARPRRANRAASSPPRRRPAARPAPSRTISRPRAI